ncbi:hypothetical protein Z043_124202, partial [Scleropages formosus]
GERNTSYQRRWFVLKGNILFYKDRPGDRDLLGVIVLEGCSVQLCESDEQFAFSLVFSGAGHRIYKLAADDQPGQESWIKALLSANHDFLSLLLKDLEKQYEGEREEGVGSAPGAVRPRRPDAASDAKRSAYLEESRLRCTVIGPDAEQLTHSLCALTWGGPASGAPPGAREARSYSANSFLQAQPVAGKSKPSKSPKLWPKRNAHVTPINGPAPPLGEWPLVGSGPLEDFPELHEHYGKEIKELRAKWLQVKREEQAAEGDLIDFG